MNCFWRIFFLLFLSLNGYCQKVTSSESVVFGEVINSDREEISPLLSSDGSTLYFVRALHPKNKGGQYAGSDIWSANLDDKNEVISITNELSKWNNTDNNAVVGLAKGKSTVYLLNSYSTTSGVGFSKMINGKWTKPEAVNVPGLRKSGNVGLFMSPKYDFLLISMKGKGTFGMEDLYVSTIDSIGRWSEPTNLGSTINTRGFEMSPFMSNDGKLLFFASSGRADGLGEADIYVSERLYDDWTVWSEPVNLGPKINSDKFDAYFSMGKDGRGYFASNKESETGFSDLYYVDDVQIERIADRERKYLSAVEYEQVLGKEEVEIYFEPNSAELLGEWKELLWYVSQKIGEVNNLKISIVGRIRKEDELGDADLALQRSLTVNSFLRFAEFNEEQISLDNHLSYTPNDAESAQRVSGVKLRLYRE
jgi:hypothetical protein